MSKKDYQAIARVIHARVKAARSIAGADNRLAHYAELTGDLADIFAADNARFDRARFLEACETGRCRGMRA